MVEYKCDKCGTIITDVGYIVISFIADTIPTMDFGSQIGNVKVYHYKCISPAHPNTSER